MRIILSGGTGFLGRHLTSFLAGAGHECILVGRSDLKSGKETISKIIKSADVVINLAGSPVINRWTVSNKEEMTASRLKTTAMLVGAISSLQPNERPSLFLSASAIGIYDSAGIHDEDSERYGQNFLSSLCQKWEAAVEPLHQLAIRTCILRTGIILEKDGGMLKKLLPIFRMGFGGKIGSGQQAFSAMHALDYCRAVGFMLENKECSGIYNMVCPDISTNSKFTRTLASACNRPAIFSVPPFAIRLMYGSGAVALLEGQSVYPKRLLEQGFAFRYPSLNEMIAAILELEPSTRH